MDYCLKISRMTSAPPARRQREECLDIYMGAKLDRDDLKKILAKGRRFKKIIVDHINIDESRVTRIHLEKHPDTPDWHQLITEITGDLKKYYRPMTEVPVIS